MYTSATRRIAGAACLAALLALSACHQPPESEQPNFIIIFTDDQGYADLSSYGGQHVSTPSIDRMAAEGVRLTNFYVAAPLCSPSRAALLTGSYPIRNDMAYGSDFLVLLAEDPKGLHPDEITLAEILQDAGYRTGMFGKWHLGDQPEFLPTRQGFDEFFGIPYSHDIHPYHPKQALMNFPPLPLLEDETVIETDPDADRLTRRFTDRAIGFIRENRNQPFFLYLAHPMPHQPLHISPEFMRDVPAELKEALGHEGDVVDYPLRDGLFRQVMKELDGTVQDILDTLRELNLDHNTLVIFTSDNGPYVGSAEPLQGRKGSTFEGGMRVPAILRWPGTLPTGEVNHEIITTMDLLPTLAGLAGAESPRDRKLDGKDVWIVLNGQDNSPHQALFYYFGNELQAVRSGAWKLHIREDHAQALYNLDTDIGEHSDVLSENPSVAQRLLRYAREFKADVADNSRPAGWRSNLVTGIFINRNGRRVHRKDSQGRQVPHGDRETLGTR